MIRGLHDITVPSGPVQVTDGVGALTVDIEEKDLIFVTGTAALSGDNTLIAAPAAGNEIVIVAIQIQNESVTETLSILKFGTTAKWRFLAKDKGANYLIITSKGNHWHVGDNTAVILNLNGVNSFGYNIVYYTKVI